MSLQDTNLCHWENHLNVFICFVTKCLRTRKDTQMMQRKSQVHAKFVVAIVTQEDHWLAKKFYLRT